MTTVKVPQHVLIDRVRRALEPGARLIKREPNTRDLSGPGAFAILRPVRTGNLRARHGTSYVTWPGTLEDLARELGVLDAERLVP